MIIKCIVCKEEFEQNQNSSRSCGNHDNSKGDIGYSRYIHHQREYYQNPKYQWYREFIDDEKIYWLLINRKIFKGWA